MTPDYLAKILWHDLRYLALVVSADGFSNHIRVKMKENFIHIDDANAFIFNDLWDHVYFEGNKNIFWREL